MRFPLQFSRIKPPAAGTPTLGADTTPVVTTTKQGTDNNLSFRELRLAEPPKRIVVGFWTTAGSPTTLPVALWVFDDASGKYYLADTGTLTNGALTYLRFPNICQPPATQANLPTPSTGTEALIVVSDNSAPNGTYNFVAGPDLVEF